MNFKKLDQRLEAQRHVSQREQSLWENNYQNAMDIAKTLVAVVESNRKQLLQRGIDCRVEGKKPYLRVFFRLGFECIEVQIVYFGNAFYLIAEKNSKRLYAFEQQLSPELTYVDLENYLETLITENI